MKFVIAAILLVAGSISEIALNSASSMTPPVSKKLDLILPKSLTDPFLIRTHNVVQKISSDRSPVIIYSGNGEVLTAKPKRTAISELAPQIPFIRKIHTNPPNHKYFRNYEVRPGYYDPDGRKLEESEIMDGLAEENETAELYDDTMTVEDYTSATQQELESEETISNNASQMPYDDAEAIVRDPLSVTDLSNEIAPNVLLASNQPNATMETTIESTQESDSEHSMAMQLHMEHLNIAYSHISNIINQLRNAVEDRDSGNQHLMSEKTKNLIQNFLANHDFLEAMLSGSQESKSPPFYNYFTDEYMTIDDLEAQLGETDIVNEEVEVARARKAFGVSRVPRVVARVQSNGRRKLIRPPLRSTVRPRLTRRRIVRRLRRRPIRRTMDNNAASIVTPYEKVQSNRDSAEKTLRLVPPQNLNSSHMSSFIVIVESLKAFYDSSFAILPDPSNIKEKNDQTTRIALENYRLIQKFYETYTANIKTFEADLDMMRNDFKAIQLGLHNSLNFFGYEVEYQRIKCQLAENCSEVINNLNTAVEVQARLYSDRVSNTIIYIDENKADIQRMTELINRISFPGQNQSLFSQEFIDTLNYANDKLPKILDMKEPVYRHILDLRSELQVIKDQQVEFDKIFAKAHTDVAHAEALKSASARNTYIGMALAVFALLL